MIYLLSNGWHDTYDVTVIEGPSVQSWSDLCISLIDESVKDLLDDNDNFVDTDLELLNNVTEENEHLCPPHICLDSIKDKIIAKLINLGYRVLEPENLMLSGTLSIINNSNSGEPLISYAEIVDKTNVFSQKTISIFESVLKEETKVRLMSYLSKNSISN